MQAGLAACTCWTLAAVWFDFPVGWLKLPLLFAYLSLLLFLIVKTKRLRVRLLVWTCTLFLIMGWWFSLKPSNDLHWQTDVARLPWAEMRSDVVILHNVRNFEYATETNYIPHWETRELRPSQILGVDLFLTYWGSPWIAHAIVSFAFADGQRIAMSIEARKEVGESYSALRGFFRQYELVYLAAEERDIVRLRTNYRKDEFVYLYRTLTTAADARHLFFQYLKWMKEIQDKPEWYNAFTSNCTSSVTAYLAANKIGGVSRWDWRNVLNGRGDEMLYDLGDLATGGLSFPDLKRRALINSAAQRADSSADFSEQIRKDRPGFPH